MARRIDLIQGSSVDPAVVAQVAELAAEVDRVMVILDSNHTHEHVLAELEAYAPMVTARAVPDRGRHRHRAHPGAGPPATAVGSRQQSGQRPGRLRRPVPAVRARRAHQRQAADDVVAGWLSALRVAMTAGGLGPEPLEQFRRDGYAVLEGFYDVERDVEPIRRGIHDVIGLVADEPRRRRSAAAPTTRRPSTTATSPCATPTVASPGSSTTRRSSWRPFVRLVASSANEELFARIRDTGVIGVAGGGSGIRIDNPGEDRYRAWWHQEYPAQFRSLDGVVMWSPLRSLTPELGPVEISIGSHLDGLIQVERDDRDGRDGAYALRLVDEDEVADSPPDRRAARPAG